MITVTVTTYDPDGQVFAPPSKPVLTPYSTVEDAMKAWVSRWGYHHATKEQVVKCDHMGFFDVVTFREESIDHE